MIVIKYGRKNSVYLRYVIIFYLFIFYDFHSFFLSFFIPLLSNFKFLSCTNLCLFMRVKLIDYQYVNRSDFKAGSGPVSIGESVL